MSKINVETYGFIHRKRATILSNDTDRRRLSLNALALIFITGCSVATPSDPEDNGSDTDVYADTESLSDDADTDSDECPLDDEKVLPGICGCGVADIDNDGDEAPDCYDSCPNDPNKTEPGNCGCGQSDGSCPEDTDNNTDTDTVVGPFDKNLLTNPGAETGDLSGWSIISNGGDGWEAVDSNTQQWNPHAGSWEFATSWGEASRAQTINLISAGFSAAELDAQPIIFVEDWFREIQSPDPYHIIVNLKDSGGAILDTWSVSSTSGGSGNVSTDDVWFRESHTFTNYGPGLRYIFFQDGGRDSESWAGHYGIRIDDASVVLQSGS